MSLRLLLSLAALLVLAGCATPANHYDPLESVNRPIYKFNETADRYVLKPVAKGYDFVLPGFVKKGVSNFFGNINDVFTAANGLLQGKPKQAGSDTLRVALNTTLGLGGLFDVATVVGLEKHDEDFGQTLGYWGMGSGPYLMLPLLGPTTARDSLRYPIDFYLSPTSEIDSVRVRNSLRGLNIVDKRRSLFRIDPLLEDALDPYTFVRDAYLQQRYNAVWDGKPPTPLKLNDDEDEDMSGDSEAPAEAPAAAPAGEAPAAPADPLSAAPAPEVPQTGAETTEQAAVPAAAAQSPVEPATAAAAEVL